MGITVNDKPEIRQPGVFPWVRLGRGYTTWLDGTSFTLSVDERGRKSDGTLNWRVREVLGNMHLGQGWHDDLDDAILEAESILRSNAPSILKAIEKVRQP